MQTPRPHDLLWGLHACENDRGVPGGGLVPWREIFAALKQIWSPQYRQRICAAQWRRRARQRKKASASFSIMGLNRLRCFSFSCLLSLSNG